MPSEFQMILMSLQGDLNNLTLSSLAANQAITGILGLYSDDEEFSLEKNKRCVSKWAVALNGLDHALNSFLTNVNRLEDYLDGKG